MTLILGSQSPRRRELLERMGLRFQVLTAEIDETKFETDDPERSVRRICAAKAAAVADKLKSAACGIELASDGALMLSSDTIVVLDGRIMGKPHDEAEACAMLAALSGREHAVYTAFTLLPVAPGQSRSPDVGDAAPLAVTHCEKTYVRFRELAREEIAAYVATGEPMDKAGAYGIQNLGAMLVESICGDYFTVMGLPVCRVALELKKYGLDPLLKQENNL